MKKANTKVAKYQNKNDVIQTVMSKKSSLFEYEKKKRAWKRRRAVLFITFVILLVSFFVFGFVSKYVFGPDAWITQIAEENIVGMINVVTLLETNLNVIFRALSVVFVGTIIMLILLSIIRAFAVRGSNRSKTVTALVASFVKYIGVVVIFGILLSTFGVNTTTLLASAGVIGIIIGLGAQSLVSDILAGLFIVFENAFQVGDIITVDASSPFRGTVIDIGLRTTKIKNLVGDLKIINNSEIRALVNMSRHSSFAICEVTISYSEDLQSVERIVRSSLTGIGEKLNAVTETPQYLGVSEFSSRGIVLRIMARCIEDNRLQLTRDLNREMKLLFDKHKIKIAVEQVEVKTNSKK